ncbi:transposase [Streptomyces sp. NPDC047453]|uniref:transposase n=1 Tax=Streptomyces sp. NPDC047453 TaxID=3154812 RepID=UPI0033FD2269
MGLLATARTRPDRELVRDLLYRFCRRCADAGLPELQRLATTVETWWPEILALLCTGITNAGSEGTNRVIKTVAREPTVPQPRQPALTHPLRDHPASPWAPRRPLISLSPHL